MPSMPVRSLGEWGLLDRLSSLRALRPRRKSSFHTRVGWGDDAFVAKMSTSTGFAFTTDTLVEGTHFDLGLLRRRLREKEVWQDLGHKAIAVNLSDLAAMGAADPVFALVTIGLSGDISVDSVDNLYLGMGKIIHKFGFFIAGGDIIRSDKTIISVTVVGEMRFPQSVKRQGARNGDILMCSGPLGLSSAGLEVLRKAPRIGEKESRFLIKKHMTPEAQMKFGAILGGVDKLATAMLDTSDDLATSVEILARASGVGFEVGLDSAPIPRALESAARALRRDPLSFVLFGGEDYQLLFTVAPRNLAWVRRKLPQSWILGKARSAREGIRFFRGGRALRFEDKRFRHF